LSRRTGECQQDRFCLQRQLPPQHYPSQLAGFSLPIRLNRRPGADGACAILSILSLDKLS
jgi:hypothetical protein